jgi:sugar phosphate isomerase/epimerase
LLGLEVGLDRSELVQKYLSRFEYESLQITYDPANLLLNGHDPLAELGLLAGRVVAVHARDARRATFTGVGQEAAVGQGDLDWLSILALLGAMDYRGFLCLEREAGTQRWADTVAGVAYLQRFLPTTR